MAEHTLSILHISDLHARSVDVSELPEKLRDKRRRKVEREAASRARVLGEEWDDNLRALFPGSSPDLVCFTGDVADWGLRAEYREAQVFIERLERVLGVRRDRIYVVPGNHDVQRYVSKREWKRLRALLAEQPRTVSDWLAGGDPPKGVSDKTADALIRRCAAFWEWVEHGLERPELLPARHAHHRLGYCHRPELGLPFPVHMIGLDSGWMAGDDHDQGKLWLTHHQADMLLRDGGSVRKGFRLALMHHPPTELADVSESKRELARCVDLVLHGHRHDPEGTCLVDLGGQRLRVLAAGCLFEGSEQDAWKNGCQRIDVTLTDRGRPLHAEIHFRAWSPKGHWHPDSSLYRNTDRGRMIWHAWNRDDAPAPAPEPEVPALSTDDTFVGREAELKALDELVEGSARIAIAAVHGMPGVGKSFLAEHFAERRFKGCWHRISLNPHDSRTGEELFSSLANRLRVEPAHVIAALSSPPSLVLVDNVDTKPLVSAVVDFAKRIEGVPLLVTGRYDELGRAANWHRIPLREHGSVQDALEQLRKEGVDVTRDEASLREMIEALGRLPLALSLAAGYLRTQEHSPQTFLDELRRCRLGLDLEDPSDPRTTGSEAERFVIAPSFELSWNHLRHELMRAHVDEDEVETMLCGLVSLAHGPVADLGLELAMAVAGLDEAHTRKMLAKATSLSLLRRAERRVAWALHPLIAEFLRLRQGVPVTPEAVRGRVSMWFMDQLEQSSGQGDERSKARNLLLLEGEALDDWLRGLTGQDAYAAAEAGFDFAEDCGPYAQWIHLYERVQVDTLDASQRSKRLRWLITLALWAGDLDLALRAAEQKVEMDRGQNEWGVAFAQGKIADIFKARGDLDRALGTLSDDVLPAFERLGDVHAKAVTCWKIALLRLEQADETSRSDATDLMSQAYRALARMRLPEAATLRQHAERHGLTLELDDPA